MLRRGVWLTWSGCLKYVKKDYGANYMLYSVELLGILSEHIIAHGEHTLLEPHFEEQFDI